MDDECHRLLYRNSSISLFESYIAIEKFIIDTRLSFVDQYKLFDLLKKLLPNEDNQLTCQGFLSWLVWRVDQYKDQQHDERDIQPNKRLFSQTTRNENDDMFHKRSRMSKRSILINNTEIYF